MRKIGRCQIDKNLAFSPSQQTRRKKNEESNYAQIGDVPRVDQRLDNKPIIRRLPKIRAALASLGFPRFALCHAPHKNILNATPPPQRIKLLSIINRTAKLQPFANCPIVLDMRTLV